MDPEQSLQLLDQIVQQVSMPRQQHLAALRASMVIRQALAPQQATSGETPAGPALVD